MYTTSQKQGVNQIITAVNELAYDKTLTPKEKSRKVKKIVFYAVENSIFTAVATGTITTIFNGIFGDAEDDEVDKAWYDTAADTFQSLASGLGYSGYIINMVLNSLRDNDWKNELPVYQEAENLSEGAAALITAMLNGEISDEDWKTIEKAIPTEGMVRQLKDFDKAVKREKTFTEALMGWKSDKEKKKFKPKDDKIYESIFGKSYSGKKGGKRRSSRKRRTGR
jgi:hypothetical protein